MHAGLGMNSLIMTAFNFIDLKCEPFKKKKKTTKKYYMIMFFFYAPTSDGAGSI